MSKPLLVLAAWVALFAPASARASTGEITPTPGAVSVISHGAVANDGGDDSAAFKAAIAKAATLRIRAGGPNGTAQGVVYVPAGSYRVCGVRPLSNVRIEFDAGAVMMLGKASCGNPAVILFDGGVANVSAVGVGTSMLNKPVPAPGWDISHSFTINGNPQATGVTPEMKAIAVRWATDVLIENVRTFQNDSRTSGGKNTAWTSNSPAVTFYGLPESTAAAPKLPRRVRVENLYNTNSPVSYGAVQVSACLDCTFVHVFSRGGVALRLETDAEEAYFLKTGRHYYSIVDRLVADDIEGMNGRQAMTFSAHNQKNGVVTATNVRANSTYTAVRLQAATKGGLPLGYFSSLSSVTGLDVTPGLLAQIQMAGSVGWTIGASRMAVEDTASTFNVRFTNVDCGGLPSHSTCS